LLLLLFVFVVADVVVCFSCCSSSCGWGRAQASSDPLVPKGPGKLSVADQSCWSCAPSGAVADQSCGDGCNAREICGDSAQVASSTLFSSSPTVLPEPVAAGVVEALPDFGAAVAARVVAVAVVVVVVLVVVVVVLVVVAAVAFVAVAVVVGAVGVVGRCCFRLWRLLHLHLRTCSKGCLCQGVDGAAPLGASLLLLLLPLLWLLLKQLLLLLTLLELLVSFLLLVLLPILLLLLLLLMLLLSCCWWLLLHVLPFGLVAGRI